MLGIISLFLLVGYSSYALFTVKKENKEAIRIVTGTLTGTLTSEDSAFQENKITVDVNTKKEITITLTNNNGRDAKLNFYYVDNVGEKVVIGYTSKSNDVPPTQEGIVLEKEGSKSYTIKIRNEGTESVTIEFGSDGGLPNKELTFKENRKCIGIYQERDSSGANMPVLADNMIPVVYDVADKRWEKADITSEWYNYDKQEWANAVTVTSTSRSGYQQAKAGVEVKMDDILQMWVWIPRYSYTIKSEDGTHYYGKKEVGRADNPSQALPGEIDVKFINVNSKDTNGSAQYTGGTATNWYTPPGFTFGGKELPGIWIGKFETGSINNTSPGDVTTDNLSVIKPNITSWRHIRASTVELVAMGVTNIENMYGFDQNSYDAHATKNTEWALICYLTQSKYGKYGNPLYSGANKQVYMNNMGYMTGCSSGLPSGDSVSSCGNAYDVMIDRGSGQGYAGGGASSTGNIYGIYDINGGAYEYVMGNLAEGGNRRSGANESRNSGYIGKLMDGSQFTTNARVWQEDKYYDYYNTAVETTACNGTQCKGHALNELAGWYGDSAIMVTAPYAWGHRGGGVLISSRAGTFSYEHFDGAGDATFSFRQVLTPM